MIFICHQRSNFTNAPVPYPTMHHSEQKCVHFCSSEQKCAHFCSEWCTGGYGTGTLWGLWIRSLPWHNFKVLADGTVQVAGFSLWDCIQELVICLSWCSGIVSGVQWCWGGVWPMNLIYKCSFVEILCCGMYQYFMWNLDSGPDIDLTYRLWSIMFEFLWTSAGIVWNQNLQV